MDTERVAENLLGGERGHRTRCAPGTPPRESDEDLSVLTVRHPGAKRYSARVPDRDRDGPIGQTIADRARAAELSVAAVEREPAGQRQPYGSQARRCAGASTDATGHRRRAGRRSLIRYRGPGPNLSPRGLRNPTERSGARTRTSCPLGASFDQRGLTVGSGAGRRSLGRLVGSKRVHRDTAHGGVPRSTPQSRLRREAAARGARCRVRRAARRRGDPADPWRKHLPASHRRHLLHRLHVTECQ